MILCSGEFPIIDAGRAVPRTHRANTLCAPSEDCASSQPRVGNTAHGRPPPVLGAKLVYAMWWVAFAASALQWACS